VSTPVEELTAVLGKDRELLGRKSTADRVAALLRERILEGFLRPGTRLSEEAIGGALGVSRNTLREAFRMLARERLLEHELNRGVFVRTVSEADAIDLYRVRRYIEIAAVRNLSDAPASALSAMAAAAAEGERAAGDERWSDVGTANMHFHQALVTMACCPRLEDFMHQVLAELRLVFHVMVNAREFHEPYLQRNQQILSAVESGDTDKAVELLEDYLSDAENQLVNAYHSAAAPTST
jgi:DNA-binding GntR family transcriptional regulator